MEEMKRECWIKILHKKFSIIASIIVIAILVVFPLYFKDYYFDILVAKYQFYYITILVAFAIALIIAILMGIRAMKSAGNVNIKRVLNRMDLKKLPATHFFLFTFWGIAAISTVQSEYMYEAFWGNEGRFTGLFLLTLYALSFLFVSRFFKLKKWYLDLFLLSAMLVCMFGITDYFKLNLLHFKDNVWPDEWTIYTSTFGNINTYNAYVGLVIGACAALFIYESKSKRKVWYFVCYVITSYALITGGSDNAYLALLALFGLMPLWVFKEWKGVKDYFILLATFGTIIYIAGRVHIFMGDKVEWLEGIFKVLIDSKYLSTAVIASWAWVLFLNIIQRYSGDRIYKLGNIPRYIWSFLVAIIVAIAVFSLYDANIAGNNERYGNLQRYVYFDDNWGTKRGMIWRIAIEDYTEKFTISQKLFGYGPDTFGIMTHKWNNDETLRKAGAIYDSAHNEYLQYFVTIGPFGLFAYLGLIIAVCMKILKNAIAKPYMMGIFFAIVCYSAQALVNINVPIATPIMWMMLSIGLASYEEKS